MNELPLETKTKRHDFLSAIALKKLNLSAPWSHYGWKVVEPDGLLVKVAMERTIAKGKRKGQPKWEGETHEVFITRTEIRAAEHAWEDETGKCHQCGGDGQEWAGWHHIEGTRYRTCTRCNGSGVSPTN